MVAKCFRLQLVDARGPAEHRPWQYRPNAAMAWLRITPDIRELRPSTSFGFGDRLSEIAKGWLVCRQLDPEEAALTGRRLHLDPAAVGLDGALDAE